MLLISNINLDVDSRITIILMSVVKLHLFKKKSIYIYKSLFVAVFPEIVKIKKLNNQNCMGFVLSCMLKNIVLRTPSVMAGNQLNQGYPVFGLWLFSVVLGTALIEVHFANGSKFSKSTSLSYTTDIILLGLG